MIKSIPIISMKAFAFNPPLDAGERQARKMFSAKESPLPAKAPQQQSGTYCPKCGRSHKLGVVCQETRKAESEHIRFYPEQGTYRNHDGKFATGPRAELLKVRQLLQEILENIKADKDSTSSANVTKEDEKLEPNLPIRSVPIINIYDLDES